MYPGAIPSYAGFTAGHTLLADNHAAQSNAGQSDIIALATKLGIGASTPASGLVLRSSGAGVSAWGQVNQATDVSGVLPTANGGSGNASLSFPAGAETVVGRAVSETLSNKTLTTPTIASFINALHDHTNSAGGGQLNAASALQSGTVNFANLLSTIFSGQVQSQANAGTAGGTIWWVNLGGIKILWATSISKADSTTPTSYNFTLPSFLSTVQTALATAANPTSIANVYATISGYSASSVDVYVTAGGVGTIQINLIVIGT